MSPLGPAMCDTVHDVADDVSFAEKIKTIGFAGKAPKSKSTVDEHGTHNVVVTEHSTKNDRVDVTITPPTVHKTRS